MKSLLWWILFVVGVASAIYFIPRGLTQALNCDSPTLVVISRSMYPVLNRGDLILVKGVTPEEIEVGTVVVFHHQDGLSVHRVVRIRGESITTRGDANTKEDNPITYDDIVGRVPNVGDGLLKIPLIGRIALVTTPEPSDSQAETNLLKQMARYVWNPIGFSLLVLLPAVLFFGSIAGDVKSVLSPARNRNRLRKKRLERITKRFPNARIR